MSLRSMPRIRWNRPIVGLLLGTVLLPWSVVRAPALAQNAGEDRSPLEPAEALKRFQVDPGLRIELVAAEPTVIDPVEIDFDAKGRMWVVEMGDYPNGPPDGSNPIGRIKILEDRDGDGIFETSTVFADRLLFANGVLPWRDGAIVTSAPSIEWLRDTDGDDRTDARETLYTGFAVENVQLRVSHPTLGLDNWIYVSNGLRGGKAVAARTPDATPIDLSGRDFRFDPIRGLGEAISGMGQYGLTFDRWGRRFVCDNRHHLRHVVFPDDAARRNPYLPVREVLEDTSILEDGQAFSGGKIYPISKNWTTSSLHAGHFTAACGIMAYEGDALPETYRGAVLTCDPTGNLVHVETLEPAGATFVSRPLREGVEFLASTDSWFRPVNLTTGPDGALYVVDMYRAVIEHPEWMPEELRNRPDLRDGDNRGRIWRIVPEGRARGYAAPDLSAAGSEQLADLLGHPNAWHRLTAQRLLRERGIEPVADRLKALATEAESPVARVQAAYLLDAADALDDAMVVRLLDDPHPRVREHAVRIAEPRLAAHESLQRPVLRLAEDEDAAVRFQVALSLGAWDNAAKVEPLAAIALRDADDPWARLAVASAVPDRAAEVLGTVTARVRDAGASRQGIAEMVQLLAGIVGARHKEIEVAGTLHALGPVMREDEAPLRLAALEGLADGLGRSGTSLNAFLNRPDSETYPGEILRAFVRAILDEAAILAARPDADVELRPTAIRLLVHAPWDRASEVLRGLLDADPDPAIRLEAVRALGAHESPEVTTLLLDGWPSYSPAIRRVAAEALLRDEGRTRALLDAIATGHARPGDLELTQARRLAEHRDPEIRARASELLKRPGARREALERYQPAVTMHGTIEQGRTVFEKHCATCHRVGEVGVDVGPDIADSRTKTREALLGDILDPNQAIDGNYVGYVVALNDGTVFDGVIAAETATSLTLRRPEGKTEVLLRSAIEEVRSTGQSLMPEGLEANISVEEMADLLTFLKDWRYQDGEVPGVVASGASGD